MIQNRLSVVHQAVQMIENNILSHVWKLNEQLPSQLELSKSLDISRASLREALSIIEAKGLIRIQPGKGVFVISNTLLQKTNWPFMNYSLVEVFEIRLQLEGYAAEMAARFSNAEDIERLCEIKDIAETAAKEGCLVTVQQSDIDFHNHIVEMSQNQLLKTFIKQFRKPVEKSKTPPRGDYAMMALTLREHALIYENIANCDAKGAKEAMQKHILNAALRANVKVRI